MIIREAKIDDIKEIDRIINRPDVSAMISPGQGILTLEGKIGRQVVYVCEGGVMLADRLWGSTFAFLVAFDEEHRGIWSVIAMRKALRKLFTETECKDGYVTIFNNNLKSSKVCAALGIAEPVRVGSRRASHITYLSWALADKVCEEIGFRFVEANNPHHTVLRDDAASFGAFLLTASRGNIGKALEQFDTYRIIGGRPQVRVIDEGMATFTFGSAKFTLDEIVDFVGREVGNG